MIQAEYIWIGHRNKMCLSFFFRQFCHLFLWHFSFNTVSWIFYSLDLGFYLWKPNCFFCLSRQNWFEKREQNLSTVFAAVISFLECVSFIKWWGETDKRQKMSMLWRQCVKLKIYGIRKHTHFSADKSWNSVSWHVRKHFNEKCGTELSLNAAGLAWQRTREYVKRLMPVHLQIYALIHAHSFTQNRCMWLSQDARGTTNK